MFVVPQMTWFLETFSTVVAVEVLFSSVDSLVNVEIGSNIESLSTFTTSKFPFVSVANLVLLQHIFVLETFLTNDAQVGHGRTIIFVIFETELWLFPTIVAAVNCFTILPFHVLLQSSFSPEVALANIAIKPFHCGDFWGANFRGVSWSKCGFKLNWHVLEEFEEEHRIWKVKVLHKTIPWKCYTLGASLNICSFCTAFHLNI